MHHVKTINEVCLDVLQASKKGGEWFENLADFGCAEAHRAEAQL
jgi:hypothetical protein